RSIRQLWPTSRNVLGMAAADIGQPLQDATLRFSGPDLLAEAQKVLAELRPHELEIQVGERWYQRRILPHRTRGNVIKGVVIVFADVTAHRARHAQAQIKLLADSLPQLVAFVDHDRIIRFCNSACNDWFGAGPEGLAGRGVAAALGETAATTLTPFIHTALAGKATRCSVELHHAKHGE